MTAFKKPLCGILSILLVFVFVAAAPITVFAEDEETTRDLLRQGNIGVTSTQSLIRQQIDLTQFDNLIERIVQLFIVENCVL